MTKRPYSGKSFLPGRKPLGYIQRYASVTKGACLWLSIQEEQQPWNGPHRSTKLSI